MNKYFHTAIGLWLIATACHSSASNPEPVIYGSATHKNGTVITGTIRWGEQEQFLSDIFNGHKIAVVGYEHLTAAEQQQILDHQPGPQADIAGIRITFKSIFGKELLLPEFNVFFGSIQRIDMVDAGLLITLHDGTQITSNEGSNDLSDEIYIKNAEGETTEFELDDLTHIEFAKAPADAKTFTAAIYGTVKASTGTYQGRIIWDKDERTVDEKLDGHANNQEHAIKFTEITSITKADSGNAAKVQLVDGQSLLLNGTNDVNNGHRGIWLNHPELGRIEITWAQFEHLQIESVDVPWMDFDDYQRLSQQLSGSVVLTDGTTIKAEKIAYNLNQQSQAELLVAEITNHVRQLPWSNFKSVHRLNNQSIELVAHDSNKVIASNSSSVTRDNRGILVSNGSQHQWIPWAKIQAISFD